MDLEDIMLSEISQSEKDKYHVEYMWNLKNKINEQTNLKQTYRHRADWLLPEGTGFGGLEERGERIKKYGLVVTK